MNKRAVVTTLTILAVVVLVPLAFKGRMGSRHSTEQVSKRHSDRAITPPRTSLSVLKDYPKLDFDRDGINSLLEGEGFDELTKLFEDYQSKFENDYHFEFLTKSVFSSFNDSKDPEKTLNLLQKWQAHSPNSFAPWISSSLYWLDRGFNIRGTEFIKDTPQQNLVKMADCHRTAWELAKKVIAINPHVMSAYGVLISIAGAGNGDRGVVASIFNNGRSACPLCVGLWESYMWSQEPKWGGSPDLIKKLVLEAQPQYTENPRFKCLENSLDKVTSEAIIARDPAKDGKRASNETLDQSLAVLDRAVARCPEPSYLIARGWLLLDLERDQEALDDFTLAYELLPTNDRPYYPIARALYFLNRYPESIESLRIARKITPTEKLRDQWVIKVGNQFASEGFAAAGRKEFEKAVELYTYGLEYDPSCAEGYFRRSEALQSLGKVDKAKLDRLSACAMGYKEAC